MEPPKGADDNGTLRHLTRPQGHSEPPKWMENQRPSMSTKGPKPPDRPPSDGCELSHVSDLASELIRSILDEWMGRRRG